MDDMYNRRWIGSGLSRADIAEKSGRGETVVSCCGGRCFSRGVLADVKVGVGEWRAGCWRGVLARDAGEGCWRGVLERGGGMFQRGVMVETRCSRRGEVESRTCARAKGGAGESAVLEGERFEEREVWWWREVR
jgi:hypothetical protein